MNRGSILLCFRILLAQILLLFASNSFADFGQSCSIPPRSAIDDYLIKDTVFGYILNNIDMKTHISDGCENKGDELNFCIRNAQGTAGPCKAIKKIVGDSFTLGSITTNPDLTKLWLKDLVLTVSVIENSVCLTMPTSRGEMPIVCRNGTPLVVGAYFGGTQTCKNIALSCYGGSTKSQSLVNFSGLTVQCLQETLNKVFYQTNNCTPSAANETVTMLNSFSKFGDSLRVAIRAALILYVMIYGFKLVMNGGEMAQPDKIAIFLAKFIFVSYFAVGIGPLYFQDGKETRHNGMTEIVLPVLVQLTSDFAEMVFSAGGSQGLCIYDASKYEQGYGYYKMWDAIDCRIGYYLGIQVLYNLAEFFSASASSNTTDVGIASNFSENNSSAIEAIRSPTNPTFFSAMFGFFLSGNIIVVICGLIFVIVFASIVLYYLTAYLVCLVTLYVMAYISPIFIPMVLFEQTKAYFDSWMKITLSCALQPAVIGGFLALILTMYDSAIYGTCEFQRHDYTFGNTNFSTFELRIPNNQPEECVNSAGYKLMKYYMGEGWKKMFLLIFVLRSLQDTLGLLTSMTYVLVFTFIFYFFVKSINDFASDLTGGASIESVSAATNKTIDKIAKAFSAAASFGKAAASSGGKKKTTSSTSSDKSRGGGVSGALNKASGGASDKVSVGGKK